MKKNKSMAIIAYILFFVPLLTEDKDDSFVLFHVKQGLVLFIFAFIVSAFSMFPIIGWILAPLLSILVMILFIIGILNAINGEEKELPIIGSYAKKIKL